MKSFLKHFLWKQKLWKILFFLLVLALLIFYKLFWLLFGIVIFTGILLLLFYGIGFIKNSKLRKFIKGAVVVVLIFSISIGIKLLAIGIFKIPSSSMENTLYPNDIIVVNKLIYGPKLPSSPFEIPWVNLLFYMNDYAKQNMEIVWWKYKRLPGAETIHQGDVLVFQTSRTFFIIKRCVGTPGDTLEIADGEIITNHKKYSTPLNVKNNYVLQVTNKEIFYDYLDSLKMEIAMYPSRKIKNQLKASLSEREYKQLKSFSSVKSIKKQLDSFSKKENLFVAVNKQKWTIDSMGEFVIPKKGLTIQLNDTTANIYKKTLKNFEKVEIQKKGDDYFINGKEATNYVFKNDYIFVMGDNRKNSEDSRYIGFIPISEVVGKAQYILYSTHNDVFNWDRLFKKIH